LFGVHPSKQLRERKKEKTHKRRRGSSVSEHKINSSFSSVNPMSCILLFQSECHLFHMQILSSISSNTKTTIQRRKSTLFFQREKNGMQPLLPSSNHRNKTKLTEKDAKLCCLWFCSNWKMVMFLVYVLNSKKGNNSNNFWMESYAVSLPQLYVSILTNKLLRVTQYH